jgi:hypothetical protein
MRFFVKIRQFLTLKPSSSRRTSSPTENFFDLVSLVAVGSIFIFTLGCGKRENLGVSTQDLLADQMGDLLASIDEFSGASGNFLLGHSINRASSVKGQVVFLQPPPLDGLFTREPSILSEVLPSANASSCLGSLLGSCEVDGSGHKLVRTLSNCTIGSATLSGSIELKFSSATSCHLGDLGSTATRKPNFEITGPAGGKFVTDTMGSYGQRMAHTDSGVFSFESDGIRRRLIVGITTIASFITRTESAMTLTGDFRNNRVLSGGKLIVENVTNQTQCSFIPSSVQWSLTCNCPTSGSWSISCSDGVVGSLTHQSCTEASFVLDGVTKTVKFARCGGLTP